MIAHDTHDTGQMERKTIREMLTMFPEDRFDLMTPGGYVTLRPSDAAALLNGAHVTGHPGVPGYYREVTAEELLDQAVCTCQYDQGTWYILSDFPERMPEQSPDVNMGGLSM